MLLQTAGRVGKPHATAGFPSIWFKCKFSICALKKKNQVETVRKSDKHSKYQAWNSVILIVQSLLFVTAFRSCSSCHLDLRMGATYRLIAKNRLQRRTSAANGDACNFIKFLKIPMHPKAVCWLYQESKEYIHIYFCQACRKLAPLRREEKAQKLRSDSSARHNILTHPRIRNQSYLCCQRRSPNTVRWLNLGSLCATGSQRSVPRQQVGVKTCGSN